MKLHGKKQIDIREDNKSAVVDILLKQESTMLQMSEILNLSHTALAKVVKELAQKGVVHNVNMQENNNGRPSKVYGINEACAITCAIVITAESVLLYYLDMRGFQVNEAVCENNFEDLESLFIFLIVQIGLLKQHPRLKDKILKYIYMGIPSTNFFGVPFNAAQNIIEEKLSKHFADIGIVVRRNIDYQMIAEIKYGLLKNGEQNAVLIDFCPDADVALLLGGDIYSGDTQMQGLFDIDPSLTKADAIHESLVRLSIALQFLDIREVVINKGVKQRYPNIIYQAKEILGELRNVRFSLLGNDVPAALSGAVWISTYSTLQDIILRR